MLDVKNLQFAYKEEIVLNDISFKINKGETVGLLGSNGSGKSTLLKCLSNILRPSSGSINILGRELRSFKRDTIARHICYAAQISQDFGFNVFESILLGRGPYYRFTPSDRDFEVVEELIHLMGLEKLAHRDVTRLSGGEYQKVMLARAIAQEPDLLLLDEPTNHLDVKNQIEVMNIFSHLVKVHGITSIISLHDINMAFRYVDKIMLLKDKKIFFYDNKDKLTAEHLRAIYDIDFALKQINDAKYCIIMPTDQESL